MYYFVAGEDRVRLLMAGYHIYLLVKCFTLDKSLICNTYLFICRFFLYWYFAISFCILLSFIHSFIIIFFFSIHGTTLTDRLKVAYHVVSRHHCGDMFGGHRAECRGSLIKARNTHACCISHSCRSYDNTQQIAREVVIGAMAIHLELIITLQRHYTPFVACNV